MELQYRKLERAAREAQLAEGDIIFTHVRPFNKLSKAGQLVTLRNGYAPLAISGFGPKCFVINSRKVANAEEINSFEYAHQSKLLWRDVVGQKEWGKTLKGGAGPF